MSRYKDLETVKVAIEDNEKRLTSCIHHDFYKPDSLGAYSFTYVCRNCGGKVDQMAAKYYVIGYSHGQSGREKE